MKFVLLYIIMSVTPTQTNVIGIDGSQGTVGGQHDPGTGLVQVYGTADECWQEAARGAIEWQRQMPNQFRIPTCLEIPYPTQ